MELKNKYILDACCAMKYMWFNKNHPNAIYMDIREEEKGFIPSCPEVQIKPDIVGDFRDLPNELKNHKFKLIAWDVPHFKARRITKGALLSKFGCLHPETWCSDLNKGFKELWSVLDDFGVLLLKFSDYHIKFEELLDVIPEKPLFFNIANSNEKRSTTKWFCFMKIPKANGQGVLSSDERN